MLCKSDVSQEATSGCSPRLEALQRSVSRPTRSRMQRAKREMARVMAEARPLSSQIMNADSKSGNEDKC